MAGPEKERGEPGRRPGHRGGVGGTSGSKRGLPATHLSRQNSIEANLKRNRGKPGPASSDSDSSSSDVDSCEERLEAERQAKLRAQRKKNAKYAKLGYRRKCSYL